MRSARVAIDVGVHARGWTREDALAAWRRYVPREDAIAEREIDRITRWPAQALAYKVGERKLLELRERCRRRLGAAFDVRKFHSLVLRRGELPLAVLDRIVSDALERGGP